MCFGFFARRAFLGFRGAVLGDGPGELLELALGRRVLLGQSAHDQGLLLARRPRHAQPPRNPPHSEIFGGGRINEYTDRYSRRQFWCQRYLQQYKPYVRRRNTV